MEVSQNIKLAVDAVVFGYTDGNLQVLLIRQGFGTSTDAWALPGGLVKDNENLEEAVERELIEETSVSANYLEQLYTFGSVNRDPRNRVVSVAYMALLNPNNYKPKADTDALEAKWFPLKSLPDLAFDHKQIVLKGLERLRAKIKYQPIGFELLSPSFPFSALEQLYQTILNQDLDRRNFRKKILSFGILEETPLYKKEGSGRPAKLFKFNANKYRQLEKEGFHFEIKFA